MFRIIPILSILFSVTGCWTSQSPPPASSAKPISVDAFQIGNHDVVAEVAKCVIKTGEDATISIRGKASEFPSLFQVGTAQILINQGANGHIMQTCTIKATRKGDQIELNGEMKMPTEGCSGVFQIMDGNKVILERAISVEEK